MHEPSFSTPDAFPTPADALPVAIRLLRRMNPLIGRILRSPLHGILSRNLLVLTYAGVKSGKRYSLPLSYITHEGRIYLCTRDSRWWRSLRETGPVEILLRGQLRKATPAILDSGSPEALGAFRAFLTANPKTGEMLYEVRCSPDRRPREDDLTREVLRSVVVRLVTY